MGTGCLDAQWQGKRQQTQARIWLIPSSYMEKKITEGQWNPETDEGEDGASPFSEIFKTPWWPESKLSCDFIIFWLKVWNIQSYEF